MIVHHVKLLVKPEDDNQMGKTESDKFFWDFCEHHFFQEAARQIMNIHGNIYKHSQSFSHLEPTKFATCWEQNFA